MDTPKRSVFPTILIVLALVLAFAGGVFMDHQGLIPGLTSSYAPPAAQKNFALIAEAWNVIQKNYADRSAINPTNLTYGAIGGMVNALGDTGHSRFMSPDTLKQEQIQIQGQFEGIGAEMQEKDGHATVVAPFDGSPAQRAGIKPGDIIIKVNGEDVTDLTLNEVV
ncbi:MAG TPA: PDZ domain-containing protein, partial [Anaerolineales bacterium]